MEYYQISIVIAVGFALFELLTATLISLSFAIAFIVIAAVQFYLGNFSWNREILIFSFVSFFTVIFLRKRFKKKSDQKMLSVDDINQY